MLMFLISIGLYGQGTEWEVYLIDVVELRFNRNDHFNFI